MSTADRRFGVLVVGAGPAGLASAFAARSAEASVGLVDENPAAGGQIWRGEREDAVLRKLPGVSALVVEEAGVAFLRGVRVAARIGPNALLAESAAGAFTLEYDKAILAPGARERFLPFPGWTLPNVLGAGGLQALVKSGLRVEGKRVVVAGSGPLLLAVAAYLKQSGADVALLAEQAPASRVFRFGLGLIASPSKACQAASLKRAVGGVPHRLGCWPISAHGDGQLASVSMTDGVDAWDVACDYLACGFGLVPNVELPRALGCGVVGGAVAVDGLQRTTAAGLWCVGEATGVGGLEKSLAEGRVAGLDAAGATAGARKLAPARDRARAFAAALERAFALREELKALARPDTVVCRCEDVTLSQILPYESMRAAKLQTRCGMGPCQGRVCGDAVGFLLGWPSDSSRPPVFPARLGSLTGVGR